MSRITKILGRVRNELGDISAQRYSDNTLIDYLNEGLRDFVIGTKFLKDRLYLTLNEQSAIYDVSPYALKIIRVEYLNSPITSKSMAEMDAISEDWQSEVGTEIKYVIFDNHKRGRFRVYPRVDGSASILTQNSPYGGLVDISIGDDDYQITTLEDIDTDLDKYLVLYIIKKPKEVTKDTLDEDLEIPEEYDKAFIHYIKGNCLRSDTDSVNRQFGNEEMGLYSSYVSDSRVGETVSNNRVKNTTIKYVGAFNG